MKPKTKVKVAGRADSLPVSINKPVKIVKKRKTTRTERVINDNVANVKPKQVEPTIIKNENKQLVNQTTIKIKRQV